MKKKTKRLLFVFFIYFLIDHCIAFGRSKNQHLIDNVRQEVILESGDGKIKAQLDFAESLFEKENLVAKDYAIAALAGAKASKNDSLKMRAFFILGKIYHISDNIKLSQAYLDTALVICEEIDNQWYKSEILLRIGINRQSRGEQLNSLNFYNDAIHFGRRSGNYKIVASAYSMMGTIFRINGLYDRAIEYIIKSSINYEKANYPEGLAWASYLLGSVYADTQNFEKALEYYQQAFEAYVELSAIDQNKNGLAICKEQIGLVQLKLGDLKEARRNIEYTLEIYENSKSRYGVSNAKKNLGKVEYAAGNYPKAEQYLLQALAEKQEIGDLLGQAAIYQFLGMSQIREEAVQEGLNSMDRGLDLAIANGQKRIQMDIYAALAGIYQNMNNLDKAIFYQTKQIETQNAILSGAANIKLEQLQGIYEIAAKNDQIEELKKQNQINILEIEHHHTTRLFMIIGILVLLFVAMVLLFFFQKLRKKNYQLNEANAAKDRFFAIIAHDLRGPIKTLSSFLDLLNSQFDDFSKEELREVLQSLHKSSEKVGVLLENLLMWAQSQVNKIEYQPEQLDLNTVIYKSCEPLKEQAEKKEIAINFQMQDAQFVHADSNMLQTIIRNIVSNAIKFTSRQGKITIESSVHQRMALVSIADNGIGIEKHVLNKLFDITNTHHTRGTENEESSGLGLILVKDFIEKNKGTISLESQKDKGTKVRFTLPLA